MGMPKDRIEDSEISLGNLAFPHLQPMLPIQK